MLPEKFIFDYYQMMEKKMVAGGGWIALLLQHNLRFMYWFRKNEIKPTLFREYILYRMSRKFGIEIAANAKIDADLYLGHPYNITVEYILYVKHGGL